MKHSLDHNSVKMYDQQGSVLRVETTINTPRQMKVYRTSENDPEGEPRWLPLRKDVADLHRRCEISQKCNERYLEALAPVESTTTLGQATEKVCQRTTFHGRSAHALNPHSESDAQLLQTICRSLPRLRGVTDTVALHGFRHRDLCERLLADETSLTANQKRTRITRLLRLLRAHGLVHYIDPTLQQALNTELDAPALDPHGKKIPDAGQ